MVLCERGVRSFEDSTRNMLDLSAVPNVKGQSHLPIIVDPSHATGRPDLIPAMARAAVAAGADGVHVEVHRCPEKALSDGPQALLPAQYAALMDELRQLAERAGQDDRRLRGSARLMRPLFIAGNWKMNPAHAEAAVALAEAVKAGVGQAADVRVAVCPPCGLPAPDRRGPGRARRSASARQNMHWKPDGAYTGEVSGGDAHRRRLHPRHPRPQRAPARAGRDRRPGQRTSSTPPSAPG